MAWYDWDVANAFVAVTTGHDHRNENEIMANLGVARTYIDKLRSIANTGVNKASFEVRAKMRELANTKGVREYLGATVNVDSFDAYFD